MGQLTRRNALLSLASVGLIGLASQPNADAQTSRFGIQGKKAPALAAQYWLDGDGTPGAFSMHELAGQWVYLKCFQSWCPGCHEYGFPALVAVTEAMRGYTGFSAVAIQTVFEGFSINTQEKLRETQLRYDLRIKMGHDAGEAEGDHRPRTMRDYRTGGTPWVVIISPAGRVVFNDYHVDANKLITFLQQELTA